MLPGSLRNCSCFYEGRPPPRPRLPFSPLLPWACGMTQLNVVMVELLDGSLAVAVIA